MSAREPLTSDELLAELDRFRSDLRAGGLRESTVHAYMLGSSLFVCWLAGDYLPGNGRSQRDHVPRPRARS